MFRTAVERDDASKERGAGFFGNLFGRQSDPAADITMLQFFLSALEVRASSIGSRVQDDAAKKALVDEVRGKLAEVLTANASTRWEGAWNDAYRLERMLLPRRARRYASA